MPPGHGPGPVVQPSFKNAIASTAKAFVNFVKGKEGELAFSLALLHTLNTSSDYPSTFSLTNTLSSASSWPRIFSQRSEWSWRPASSSCSPRSSWLWLRSLGIELEWVLLLPCGLVLDTLWIQTSLLFLLLLVCVHDEGGSDLALASRSLVGSLLQGLSSFFQRLSFGGRSRRCRGIELSKH